jgi:hypothetical protein
MLVLYTIVVWIYNRCSEDEGQEEFFDEFLEF